MGPSVEIDAATLRNQRRPAGRAPRRCSSSEITVLKRLIKNTPDRLAQAPGHLAAPRGDVLRAAAARPTPRCARSTSRSSRLSRRRTRTRSSSSAEQQKQAREEARGVPQGGHQGLRAARPGPPELQAHGRGAVRARLLARRDEAEREGARGLLPPDQELPREQVRPERLPVVRGALLRAGRHAGCQQVLRARSPSSRQSATRSTATRSTSRPGVSTTSRTSRARSRSSSRSSSSARRTPKARDVANLVKQSRRELVMPYARAGTPGKALEFFSRFAEDDAQAYDMLESLAELYYDTGEWAATVAGLPQADERTARQRQALLLAEPRHQRRARRAATRSAASPRSSAWSTCTSASRPATKTDEVKKQCKQTAAATLVDLATAWHREAIGTDTQPGTNDRKTMELAAQLYRLLLEKFPDMEHDGVPGRSTSAIGRPSTASATSTRSSSGRWRSGPSARLRSTRSSTSTPRGRSRRTPRSQRCFVTTTCTSSSSPASEKTVDQASAETKKGKKAAKRTKPDMSRRASSRRSRPACSRPSSATCASCPNSEDLRDDEVSPRAHLLRGESLRRGVGHLQGHRLQPPGQRARGVRGEPVPRLAQRAGVHARG